MGSMQEIIVIIIIFNSKKVPRGKILSLNTTEPTEELHNTRVEEWKRQLTSSKVFYLMITMLCANIKKSNYLNFDEHYLHMRHSTRLKVIYE